MPQSAAARDFLWREPRKEVVKNVAFRKTHLVRIFRLHFVFHTIGLVFLNVSSCAAIVKMFMEARKSRQKMM